MRRTRFAPSPTGSLHVGNALSAVANRRLGDTLDGEERGERGFSRNLGFARAVNRGCGGGNA